MPRKNRKHEPDANPRQTAPPNKAKGAPFPRDAFSEEMSEFVQLYGAAYRHLYVFVSSVLLDSSDVDDVLQEASVTMWEKFHEFEPGTNFYRWSRTIAKYKVMNFLAKKRTTSSVLDPEAIAALIAHSEKRPQSIAREDALLECLEKLSISDRMLIESRYHAGLSVKVLASEMGRTANALSKALGRIRGTLGDCVQRVSARSTGGTGQ